MRRPGRIALVTALAVVVALLITWFSVAAGEAHSIVVTSDARPLVCAKGQEVVRDVGGRYTEFARVTQKLDCTLRIHVYNDGGVPVTLTNARFDLLGNDSATASVNIIGGRPVTRHNDGFNASGPLSGPLQADEVIAPGQSITITAHITASQRACLADGSSAEFDGAPILTLTTLGLTESRGPTNVDFGFLGTSASTSKACG